MPGAYAHIAAVYHMMESNTLDGINIPDLTKQALRAWPEFCILGAVSPDYPYLDLGNAQACEWADAMHHGGQDHFLGQGVRLLKKMPPSEDREKCYAWLLGFIAHVGMDMTIHPIVEGVAGIYAESKENQKKHRICEMHQDVHIWQTMNLGTVGRGEVIDNIRLCGADNRLHEPVRDVWDKMLDFSYQGLYRHNKPDINRWHEMFATVVDKVEESYKFPRFARHVGVNAGVTYPMPDEIEQEKYINNLRTPDGQMLHYDKIFEKAISHIAELWVLAGREIESSAHTPLSIFGDWDMDRGLKNSGGYVFWDEKDVIPTQLPHLLS